MQPSPHPLIPHLASLVMVLSGPVLLALAPASVPAPPERGRPVLARRPAALDTARALHLLERATFGARPADLAEVLRLGPEAWLERQLHPERIPDPGLEQRLAAFPAARMSVAELYAAFPPPRPNARPPAPGRDSAGMAMEMSPGGEERREMRGRRQRGPQRIAFDLAGARLARAVHSERQLEEVMADFWFNHFNVFFGKNADRWLVGDYERTAIRPHVFGRFGDLLAATARHPAMLVYLDNWTSSAPDSAVTAARSAPARRRRGLNENYARELLELHTLGVDGGYTQRDVVEVARAFTGWTLDRPGGLRGGGGGEGVRFAFRPALHDAGEKVVLGRRLPAGRGVADGEEVLAMLARHPSTARHVAFKLAQRFVADEPPPALVDRLAELFLRTGGDLRQVTRALFLSPEFGDPRYRRAKVKTPFEFVASALRATGAEARPSRGVLQALRQFGQVPYQAQAPTGYPHTLEEWTNGGAMLNRMSFALALASGGIDGVRVEPRRLGLDVNALARAVLPGRVDAALEAAVRADLAEHPELSPEQAAARALGLIVGSPAFQRR